MTITKMCFRIDGDWLTDFCRSRWADEGAPFHAIEVISSGFPDFSMNRILAILTGSLRMTGTSQGVDEPSTLTIEDDNARTSAKGNPLSFAAVMSKTFDQLIEDATDKRLQHALWRLSRAIDEVEDDRRRDQHTRIAIEHAAQMNKLKKLDNFDFNDISAPPELVNDPNAMFFTSFMAAQSEKLNPEPGPFKGNWCSWINRKGIFYPCKYFQHDSLADALGHKNGDELLTLGWVKVQEANQGLIKKPADLYWHKKPTQAQIDAIWDWCTSNNREFPKDQLDGYQDHP